MRKGMFNEIKKIANYIRNNGFGVFPCKNSYMIIGPITGNADQRIREIKGKKVVKPLVKILLEISSDKNILAYYSSLSKEKKDLIDIFKYSDLIFASTEKKIGFTFAMNPYERMLLKILKKPIYASSSNISGKPTPLSINKISNKIKKCLDFILDIGELPKREDFAVINLDNLQWFREGHCTKLINQYLRNNNEK